MKVFAHPDPVTLESELLRGIADAQMDDALAGVLVVVPTARLARHVVRRIARERGAAAGIEVLHHRGLLRKALTETTGACPAPLPETLHAALVRRILEGLPAHPWTQLARERPGAIRAVLSALTDLREAGISAKRLRGVAGKEPAGRDVAELYGEYEIALDRAAREGFADEAGLVATALPRIAEWIARFRAVFHHGAYDLTGVHLELVRAIDRVRPVRFLLAAHDSAPAYETAAAFRRRHLSSREDAAEQPKGVAPRQRGLFDDPEPAVAAVDPGRLGSGRLAAMFREDAREPALPDGFLDVRHAQGARAEVTLAVRAALAAVAAGTAPDEIAIVARSLGPYAADLEAVLDSEPLPASTTATAPLRRDPAVHDLLVLLRVVADDFPRRPTCEILASPRLRWDRLLPGTAPLETDLAESFTVEASIAGGFDEWTEDLPAWAEHAALAAEREAASEGRVRFAKWRAGASRGIARAVAALRSSIDPERAAGWAEHADAVERLARHCIRGFDDESRTPSVARMQALLGEMQALPRVLDPKAVVPFAAMVDWLVDAVGDASVPVTGAATEGVQVLDAMQARGLTFRSVFVLGMNGGVFPRAASEDPLLGDSLRRRLREATGCPIPVKSEGDREERLLLALLLGSSRDKLCVSWQRADEAGRAKPLSLALREVARLKLGRPDLSTLTREPGARLPAHPGDALAKLAESPGLLLPDEGELLTALQAKSAAAARKRLAAARPDLDARLALVEAVESFAPRALEYDGLIGPPAAPDRSISVGAFERLGACALRYFFRDVLRIDEVRTDRGLFDFDSAETGIQVHDTLQRVYSTLDAEGFFSPERRDEALARLPSLVRDAWRDAAGSAGARLARRSPVLADAHVEMWHAAILRFVREDLARLADLGTPRIELETERRTRIAIGEGVELAVHGRFDRVARGTEGTVVSDYKTSAGFAKGAVVPDMLRGLRLQVPLYSWMEDRAAVELLQVRAAPAYKEKEKPKRVAPFPGFSGAAEEGFAETLRIVADLASGGVFPLRPSESCSFCAYQSGCRHDHPPTIARLENLGARGDAGADAARVGRYQALARKTAKHALLSDVPAENGEESDE